jgi:hypothetical protein
MISADLEGALAAVQAAHEQPRGGDRHGHEGTLKLFEQLASQFRQRFWGQGWND